jgi:hypothetical protein
MSLPQQAREGLSRAWLEILKQRHPGVTWVLTPATSPDLEQDTPLEGEQQLATAA